MLRIILVVLATTLVGCETLGTAVDKDVDIPSPTAAGFPQEKFGFCPADYAITPKLVTSAAFSSISSCNTARAADACAAASLGTRNAACNTYCAANWWTCLGSVINTQESVGNSCFEDQNTNKYHYICVGTGDCHCV